MGPLAPRVADGGQPAGRLGPAPGQQLCGVGQLVEGGHLGDPEGVEQRLVGAVVAGQGAGVGGDHRPGRLAAPDLEGDHRDARSAALARAASKAAGSCTVSRNRAAARVLGSSRAWSR